MVTSMVFLVTEADKKKFRDRFFYAEQELAAAKGREKALQEQLLKEVNDSQDRLKKQIQSYNELEVHSCYSSLFSETYHVEWINAIVLFYFIWQSSSQGSEVWIFSETESMMIGSFHEFPGSQMVTSYYSPHTFSVHNISLNSKYFMVVCVWNG